MKLNCALRDGQQALLSLRLPGQLVDGTGVHWLGESYPVSAIAATECRVCYVSSEAMLCALQRNPEMAQFLLRQQCLDLYNQAVALVDSKTLNAAERFAQFVQYLAAVLDLHRTRKPVRLVLPLSNAEIASLLGITKEYFSRLKKQLQKQGRFHWEGCTVVIP